MVVLVFIDLCIIIQPRAALEGSDSRGAIYMISTYIDIRGIRTLDFSRKTTNAVLSDLQIVDVVK